jgi:uncharacterized protein (TIGR00369 family)
MMTVTSDRARPIAFRRRAKHDSTGEAAKGEEVEMTTLTRTGLAVLRDAALGNEPMPPCAELLGWQALELEPGRVRVRYAARQAFCNPQGTIQGGFVAAMLDDAMGPALYTLLDETQFAPTLEMKVSYLRPALPGTLIAEGRVTHRTRGIAFIEGTLEDENGNIVATATATARLMGERNVNGNGTLNNIEGEGN